MKQLVILPGQIFAGYCSGGGHNKDWAACVAVELEESEPLLTPLSETRQVVFISLHGSHGGTMVVDAPKKLPLNQARKHFQTKMNEKRAKGYAQIAFVPFVPAFGRPNGFPLVLQGETKSPIAEAVSPSLPSSYRAIAVKPITFEKLLACIENGYGISALSEKVNGERCVLAYDGNTLTAYNRRGIEMSAPPDGANHLTTLGASFVIDGERLPEGRFVAFDLLMWNKQDLLNQSYADRILTLRREMLRAQLLREDQVTPTYRRACANSNVEQLALLIAVTGVESCTKVLEEVQLEAGEGIILRDLTAPYTASPQKYKFLAQIDAFVLEINPGTSEGSLKFGVVRSSDKAVLEIANVRSGLSDDDVREVGYKLLEGGNLVFTLSFLPARTTGLLLVEPRTSFASLRTDKSPGECTTDQFEEMFGEKKAALIAAATPYPPYPYYE